MAHKITGLILGKEVTVFWNHRVMARTKGEETDLFIVEVYYDVNGETIGWTDSTEVFGSNIDELRQTLTWMLASLDKSILDETVLLAEAEVARETGAEDTFPSEHLTLQEVLDSLGLEKNDLGDVVEHVDKPAPIPEVTDGLQPSPPAGIPYK